jgi:hypothetical protein
LKKIFSDQEKDVIAVVKRKSHSIKELCEIIYKGYELPMYPGTVISSAIKRINLKCEKNKLGFKLELVGAAGPLGKSVEYVGIK